jgi:hypothetical protein
MQMPLVVRERLQWQIVTSRKVGVLNTLTHGTHVAEGRKDHKGDRGPPSAIPERKWLRKSKTKA